MTRPLSLILIIAVSLTVSIGVVYAHDLWIALSVRRAVLQAERSRRVDALATQLWRRDWAAQQEQAPRHWETYEGERLYLKDHLPTAEEERDAYQRDRAYYLSLAESEIP